MSSVPNSALFICQKCSAPLKMDPKFTSMDASDYSEITDSLTETQKQLTDAIKISTPSSRPTSGSSHVIRRVIHAPQRPPLAESFIMLNSKDDGAGSSETEAEVRNYQSMAKLFDTLSMRTDFEHPLCVECAEVVMESMDEQIQAATKEKELYERTLERMKNEIAKAPSAEELQAEIQELEQTELQLQKELEELEAHNRRLKEEEEELKRKEWKLELAERKQYQEYNEMEAEWIDLQMENESVENHLRNATQQLEKLKKSNVFNDAFNIWHDGAFGTINGLRLGKLPDQNVEWNEINAAWGQCALLLSLLVERVGLELKNYKIIPMGNCSKIEKVGEGVYELYGSGDLQLSRIFANRRFDQGMCGFLNCLQQLGEYAESKDASFKLPYTINKEKIGDVSIKAQFNSSEQWTKALKYTLTNLKWLLAFCCKNTKHA